MQGRPTGVQQIWKCFECGAFKFCITTTGSWSLLPELEDSAFSSSRDCLVNYFHTGRQRDAWNRHTLGFFTPAHVSLYAPWISKNGFPRPLTSYMCIDVEHCAASFHYWDRKTYPSRPTGGEKRAVVWNNGWKWPQTTRRKTPHCGLRRGEVQL